MPRDPWVSEWANPTGAISRRPAAEHIGGGGATRGTETSKYPEEEKSNEIPPVAASERGRGQTAERTAPAGLKGLHICPWMHERNGMGRPARQG